MKHFPRKKKFLSFILAIAFLLPILPVRVLADAPQFTVSVTITDEFNQDYGPVLVDGKVMKLAIDIIGPSVPREDDLFIVRIPKIFADLTSANLDIPDDNGGADIFVYTGPIPDSDPAYNVYKFEYSDTYKAAISSGDEDMWVFVRGNLFVFLTPEITEESIIHYKPIEVEDSFSGESKEVELPPLPPPDEVTHQYNKIVESVWRWDDEVSEWADLPHPPAGERYRVRPGDIVAYRLIPAVTGKESDQVTMTEKLPIGLEAYDAKYDEDSFFAQFRAIYSGYANNAYNKTNLEENTDLLASHAPALPAKWTKVDDKTYTMDVTVKGDSGSVYAHFFTKVRDYRGEPWTVDELTNDLYGTGQDIPSWTDDIEIHPDLLPESYDLALVKWIYRLLRDGAEIKSPSEVTNYENIVLADDVVTYAIRVMNQGSGDAEVRLSEIVDYAPPGLEFDPTQTQIEIDGASDSRIHGSGLVWTSGAKIAPNPANGDCPPSATPGFVFDTPEMNAGRTVTPFLGNLDQADGGNGLILKPLESVTLYISFRVRDLDEVIDEIDPDPTWTHVGRTADEIRAKRAQYCVHEEGDDRRNGSYSVYFNAAEIVTAYTTGDTPVLISDTSSIEDVDSTPDTDPFNDVYGDGSGSFADYQMLYGKEKDNLADQNAKGSSLEDEDDYDFQRLYIAAKRLPEEGKKSTYIEKRWDMTPLIYRAHNGGSTGNMPQYLTTLLTQLTGGNHSPTSVGNNYLSGDETGRIYGTFSASNGAHSQYVGQYYSSEVPNWLLGAYELGSGSGGQGADYQRRYTDAYGPSRAALAQDLSDLKLPGIINGNDIFIPDKNTVLMYTIQVNSDAMKNLKDVTLTDAIPDGFRLLTDVNGKPVVRITQYVPREKNQGYIPELDIYVDAVNRSNPDTFDVYDVKQFTSFDYLDTRNPAHPHIYYTRKGDPVILPMPVDNPGDDTAANRVGFWASRITNTITDVATSVPGITYEKDKLTVYLGDIGYASYDVSFMVVSDRIMSGDDVLENTATLYANNEEYDSTSRLNVTWNQGAIASYTRKFIVNPDTNQTVVINPLTKLMDVAIRYRIGIKSTDSIGDAQEKLAFLAHELDITDDIQLPTGAVLTDINLVGVEGYRVNPGSSAEILLDPFMEAAITNADVVIDLSGRRVSISNSDVMPQNRRYYITFDVLYSAVPAGSVIRNTAGTTVTSYAPVEISLVKEDAADRSPLPGAEFTAYYVTADGLAPDKSRPVPISDLQGNSLAGSKVVTDDNGCAGFLFSPASFNTNGEWVIFLVETKYPDGYGSASEVAVKYTITKNADETLLVINEGTETTNTSGSIETILDNTLADVRPVSVNLGAKKILAGDGAPALPADEYLFTLYETDQFGVRQGSAIQVKGNAAGTGEIVFDTRTFNTAGTYYFEIAEVIPDPKDPRITYDESKVRVTVAITETASSRLEAEVLYNGNQDEPVFVNTYTSSISISKRRITGDEELPGAKLIVYLADANGNKNGVVAVDFGGERLEWISGAAPKEIVGLPAGRYVLHEAIAPKGYRVTQDIHFEIDENGRIVSRGEVSADQQTLIMRDDVKIGKLEILKVNEVTGEPLAGAVFALFEADGVTPVRDGNGEIVRAVTGKDGTAVFANLTYGTTYVVTETSVPVNYAGQITIRVTIDEDYRYEEGDSRFFKSFAYSTQENDAVLVFAYKLSNDELTSVSGTKTWVDKNNQYKSRPSEITVNLLRNGVKIDSVKVRPNANGAWVYTFINLRKYDDSGKAYTYTVSEDSVTGYKATVKGYDISNEYTATTKTGESDSSAFLSMAALLGFVGIASILVLKRRKRAAKEKN